MENEPSTPAAPEPRLMVVASPNYKPVVTYTILGITIFVYLLQLATMYLFQVDLPLALGIKSNALIIDGQIWRLFTPMLLHDDRLPLGIGHILFNMYFLTAVGPQLEKFTGHWAFLLLYIVAGFAGCVFSFLFLDNESLGASGALFGLMGAQLIFVLQNKSFLADEGKSALQNTVTNLIINVVIGFTIPAIDIWAHIGGLAGGAIFAWFGGAKLDLEEIAFPRFRLMDVRRPHEKLFGAALVMLIFGGFAVLKLTGIAFVTN